ncbi:MAG: hypothetical protein NZ533_03195 [Casimicrobiaceae bacterium]|nr:hypothetical protein [Casimicrobiaceae bacterium]MCX8097569.1 hypothetical protein [Casimicrobiaceae bacterium]MDW8313255.1 hypothetical protein [Burkholderiales bacterium]
MPVRERRFTDRPQFVLTLPASPVTGVGRTLSALVSLAFFLLASPSVPGQVNEVRLGPGTQLTLSSGTTHDGSCADVFVEGQLRVEGGQLLRVRNLTLQPGGLIVLAGGAIELSGRWHNAGGTFQASAGVVRFRVDPACPALPRIDGSNTFFDLEFIATTPARLELEAGNTQRVLGQLTLLGPGSGGFLAVESTLPGSFANLDLAPGGSQNINHVAVSHVAATGQWLAPNSQNAPGAGPAPRWFQMPVPTLAWPSVLLLGLLLVALAAVAKPRHGVG